MSIVNQSLRKFSYESGCKINLPRNISQPRFYFCGYRYQMTNAMVAGNDLFAIGLMAVLLAYMCNSCASPYSNNLNAVRSI